MLRFLFAQAGLSQKCFGINHTLRLTAERYARAGQQAQMNPMFLTEKFAKVGKTVGMSVALTPNHAARVAPYWSSEVVGIHRPFEPASSLLPNTMVGNLPYMSPPFTAPPITK